MGIYVVVVLIVIGIIGYIFERNVYNPLSIYSFVWAFAVFLSSLSLYSQIGFSDKAYYIVLIGEFGILIGYFICTCFSTKYKYKKFNSICEFNNNYYQCHYNAGQYIVNESLWISCLVVCNVFYLAISIKVVSLMLSGVSWYMIRYYYYDNGLLFDGVLAILSSWFITPICTYVSIPMLLVGFISGYRNKLITYLVFSSILMNVFISGGKGWIVIFISVSLVCYLLFRKKMKSNVKKKIRHRLIAAVILIFVFQTVRAVDFQMNFLYGYLGITMPLIDHWVEYIDGQNILGFGRIFFYGILNIPASIFKIFGLFSSFDELGQLMDYIVKRGVTVFNDFGPYTNVYVSLYTYFYLDGRMLAVFVESVLFGFIMNNNYIKMKFFNDSYHLCIYIITAIAIMDSFIKWDFYTSAYVLSFFYLWLFFKCRIRIRFI